MLPSSPAPLSAPLNLRTTSITGTTITLTWSPPSNTGGRTDLKYRVTYAAGNIIETPNTTITLTDLRPLTTYTISVETISGVMLLDPGGQPNRTAIINVTTTGGLYLYTTVDAV